MDKLFVIGYPLAISLNDPCVIEVIGLELPDLDPAERRPLWVIVPEPSGTLGTWVDQLLRWSFDPKHKLSLRRSSTIPVMRFTQAGERTKQAYSQYGQPGCSIGLCNPEVPSFFRRRVEMPIDSANLTFAVRRLG